MGEKEWHKLFTLAGRGVQQQFQTSEFRVWKCGRTDSCQTKPHDSSLWFVNTQGQIPNCPGELSTIPYFSPRSSKSGRKQGAWLNLYVMYSSQHDGFLIHIPWQASFANCQGKNTPRKKYTPCSETSFFKPKEQECNCNKKYLLKAVYGH